MLLLGFVSAEYSVTILSTSAGGKSVHCRLLLLLLRSLTNTKHRNRSKQAPVRGGGTNFSTSGSGAACMPYAWAFATIAHLQSAYVCKIGAILTAGSGNHLTWPYWEV